MVAVPLSCPPGFALELRCLKIQNGFFCVAGYATSDHGTARAFVATGLGVNRPASDYFYFVKRKETSGGKSPKVNRLVQSGRSC